MVSVNRISHKFIENNFFINKSYKVTYLYLNLL